MAKDKPPKPPKPGKGEKAKGEKKAKVKGALLHKVTNLVLVLFLLSLAAQQLTACRGSPRPVCPQASSPAAVRRSSTARSTASSARSTALAAACTAGRSGAPRRVRVARAAARASRSSASRASARPARAASTASRWRVRSSRSGRTAAPYRRAAVPCYGDRAPVDDRHARSGWRNWQTR